MKTRTKEQITLDLSTFFDARISASDLMDWTNEAILCVHQDTALSSAKKENIIAWLTINISPVIKDQFLSLNRSEALRLTNLKDSIMDDLFCDFYNQTASYLADINIAFLNKYLTGTTEEVGQFMRTQANLMELLEIYREYDELYIGEGTKARENFLQTT